MDNTRDKISKALGWPAKETKNEITIEMKIPKNFEDKLYESMNSKLTDPLVVVNNQNEHFSRTSFGKVK